MPGRVQIRAVQDGDAETLAANLRPADRAEIAASSGRTPLDAIQRAIKLSTYAFAATRDGELACIWGFAPVSAAGGVAAPWLLGTPLVERLGKTLTHHTRRMLEFLAPIYPTMVNYVDARNTRSIAWLQAVGFTLHPAAPFGPQGLPFHRFEMEAAYV